MALILIIPMFCVPTNAVIYSDTQNHWAKDYIDYVTDKGIMVGTGTNIFSPSDDIKRGAFALVLANTLGRRAVNNVGNTGITDVESGKYYTGAAMWAVETNIMDKIGWYFMPSELLTRAQAASAIVRFCQYYGINCRVVNNIPQFYDCYEYTAEEQDEIENAIRWGFMSATSGNFNPDDTVSRAETAVIIHNLFTIHLPYMESTKYILNDSMYKWVNGSYEADGDIIMPWYNLHTIRDNYGTVLMDSDIIAEAFDAYIDSGKFTAPDTVSEEYAKIKFEIPSETIWEYYTSETRESLDGVYALTKLRNTSNVEITPESVIGLTNKNINYATIWVSPLLKETVYQYHTSIGKEFCAVNIIGHELMHVLCFGHTIDAPTISFVKGGNHPLRHLSFYDYRAINDKYYSE